MWKIIFPVVLFFLFLLVGFFGWSTYAYYEAIHSDDPIDPYVSVDSGAVTITRGDIAIDMVEWERYTLREKDIIITKKTTLAVVHWPDHSTTRIGANSRMTIDRMRVTEDYSSIEIELTLESGKIWNNVIRTIYPGSYFRAQLPKNNIIAWVRGTVFEINLDKNYIHSVDHSVALSDGFGRTATMLPGDIVSAWDILTKLGQDALDTAWAQFNILQDTADNLLHSAQMEKSLGLLKQAGSIWDRFVRWVLSFFGAFQDIQILETLSNPDGSKVMNMPKEYLLKWYQRFQDGQFIEERENIRAIVAKTWNGWDEYIDAIARGAIWDKISFSGMTLESSDALITTYTKKLDDAAKWVLKVVPVSDLQNKAKETLRNLLK